MLVTTTDFVPGYEVAEIIGVAKGSTIRAKHIGKDIMAGLRHLIGGELKGYTEMLNEARDEAMARMVTEAEKYGADAILNVRLETAEIMQGAAEVLSYGTAVKLTKLLG